MITSHVDLARAIQGKRILHLNSLGKDAVLTLDWLNNFAKVEVVSVFFEFEASYPTDSFYWTYLQKRYPRTHFVKVRGLPEMNEVLTPMFQSPLFCNYVLDNCEFDEFDFKKSCEELRIEHKCDFICRGISKYEGMGRALYIRRIGLMNDKIKEIYPIGLMNQKQVFGLLKSMGTRLNPSYRIASESHDSASYFKMRNAFLAKPAFKRSVIKKFPLLLLDQYRYERLFKK